MTTIASTSDNNYYQCFMTPPKDSLKIRGLLELVQADAQEGFCRSHFVTTGYAILIWATSFFEVIKFSGKCLYTCILEIWYLDFSEVMQHVKNDSLDCLQSIKYTICMPFVIFCGLFFPGFIYSSLEYSQRETRELQDLRGALEAAQQGEVEREQLQSELDTERANCLSAHVEIQDLRDTLAAVPQERERLRSEIEAQTREEAETQMRGELEQAEERIQGLESKVTSFELSEEQQTILLNEVRENERRTCQLLESTKDDLREAKKTLEISDDYSKEMMKINIKAKQRIIELEKQLEIAEEAKRTFGILADQLAEIMRSRLDPEYQGDLHKRLREIRISAQKPVDKNNPRNKLAEELLKNAKYLPMSGSKK